MKCFVSACLMGKKCKYNGGHNFDPELSELLKGDDVTLICPEVEGGLPIPRHPVELIERKAKDKDGNDYTSFFLKGVDIVLNRAKKENPEAFILQPRSPSCGIGYIYDGTFSSTLIEGDGLLVQRLKSEGYKLYTPNSFKEIKK